VQENSKQMNNQASASEQSDTAFISLAEAAKKTGYHQDYLGQLARSGKLDAQKVGRNWVTTRAAVNKFLGRAPEAAPQIVSPVEPVQVSEPIMVQSVSEVVVQPAQVETVMEVVAVETPVAIPAPEKIAAEEKIQVAAPAAEPVMMSVVEEAAPEVPAEPVRTVAREISVSQPVQKKVFAPAASVRNPVPARAAAIPKFPSEKKLMPHQMSPMADLQSAIINAVPSRLQADPMKRFATVNFHKVCFDKKTKLEKLPQQAAYVPRPPAHRTLAQHIEEEDRLAVSAPKKFSYSMALASIVLLAGFSFIAYDFFHQDPQSAGQPQISNLQSADEISQGLSDGQEVAGVSTSTLGTEVIPKNSTSYTVNNDSIEESSLILIEMPEEFKGTYSILSKSRGQFTLKLSQPAPSDLKFDYWISPSN
jgi:excisionase family DNA binding protein